MTLATEVLTQRQQARNIPVLEILKVPPKALGENLKADYLLENEILEWATKYRVLQGGSVVSCRSRLIEARTGALVWELDWIRIEQNNNSGGGLTGMLVGAIVESVMNSMFDVPSNLAQQGVAYSAFTQPYPGFAPRGPSSED